MSEVGVFEYIQDFMVQKKKMMNQKCVGFELAYSKYFLVYLLQDFRCKLVNRWAGAVPYRCDMPKQPKHWKTFPDNSQRKFFDVLKQ